MPVSAYGNICAIGTDKPKLNPAKPGMLQHCFVIRIMKLTVIILLTGCLQIYAGGYAQTTVTLNMKSVPLIQVLNEIRKQTGYNFIIQSELLKTALRVDIFVNNATLKEALDICFKAQPLSYTLTGKSIVIQPKREAPQAPPALATTGETDIRGIIIDEEGIPLAGANVKIKGTNIGTITNGDGSFILKRVNENAEIEISFVGFEAKTIRVKNINNLMAFSLKRSDNKLDEVQIIAYGQTTKRLSTGNVTTIKAADIEKQPVQNPLLALQGRVPGLEITQTTGINGGGVNVRIQGINSIGSLSNSLVKTSTDPLIVIDGIPFPTQLIGSLWMEGIVGGGSPLNYINPNDIESIDVLKDADATAIYGSRAANGAILITTKKGKVGRIKLSVNLQQGWSKVGHKADMLNTRQYLDMRYEAYKNDGINIGSTPNAFNYDLKLWDTTRYTNWQKELIGATAQYTNVNVGVSGGTSAMQYLIGATYNRRTTVFPGDFDDKIAGLHFNVNSSSANQKFKIQLTGSYSYDQNHLPQIDLTQQAIFLSPNAPAFYQADGTLNWAPTAAGTSSWINPLAYIINADFNNTSKTLVSNINVSYNILPGLNIKSNFGYTNLHTDLYTPTRLEFYRPEQRASQQRSATFGSRDMSTWITEPQLGYGGRVGKGKIDVLIGTTIQKSTQNYLSIRGSGQANDLLLKSLSAATSLTINNSQTSVFRFNGLFGRLNYNWNEKYLLNFTGRRDGSNKFGDGNKFHNFGSIGLGWIFSQEAWMHKTLPSLSFGKLRASYGLTGNDQILDFSYLSIYALNNSGILYQGGSGLEVTRHTNPYLQWEETRKWQGGIDLGFFSDRIIVGATYARNRSSNQLTSYELPDITGFSSIYKNLPATVQNTSWEFTLNTVNIRRKRFNWTSSINLTIPRNKLVSFPDFEMSSYASGDRGLIVGQPLGVTKVYAYAGVDPTTGNYRVYDKEGKPTTGPDYTTDRTVLISTLPSYYGGLVNSISYKCFQLDFLFQFVVQKGTNDLYYNNGSNFLWGPGLFASSGTTVTANQPVTVLNRWQKTGDQNPIAKYSTSLSRSTWPLQSDAYYSYAAGSYVRLKNLSLSWQLPKEWFRKIHLQSARIYFNGQNLATFTKYKGLDPETRGFNLPPLRTLTAGVKLDL